MPEILAASAVLGTSESPIPGVPLPYTQISLFPPANARDWAVAIALVLMLLLVVAVIIRKLRRARAVDAEYVVIPPDAAQPDIAEVRSTASENKEHR